MNPTLFDYAKAKERRDSAIDAVEEARPDWAEYVRDAILKVSLSGKEFTSDEVLEAYPNLEACPEKRVFGAAFLKLARQGLITPKGYRPSSRKLSHARPKRVWINTAYDDSP